ncbi:hypothetical protein D9758_012786 [Tetrapyrgos nigripes]|uniref:Uncharacterized protein n=1 Tax=Tetrapyrgos nigripes TaxID=182062 RepID=A0A8H5FVJ9_9AGAR|nr:hypothetical protein D9758_012786 [Tetrapyrgos nigripes]
MTPPTNSTVPQDLGTSLGAVELGIMFSSVFYGVVIIQSYKYYQASFKKDSALLKTTVAVLCALETFHTAFQWIYLYRMTISSFGQNDQLNEINWSFIVSMPLTTIIANIVQAFFSHRASRISGWGYYKAIIIPILIARAGFAVAAAVVAFKQPLLTDFTSQFLWIIILLLTMGTAIDVVNTILLSIFMEKNHNPLLRSRTIGDKIITWTIGNIYSVLAVALISSSHTSLWLFFWLQSAKCEGPFIQFRQLPSTDDFQYIPMPFYHGGLNGRISLSTAQPAAHIIPSSVGPRRGNSGPHNLEVHVEMGVQANKDDTLLKDL